MRRFICTITPNPALDLGGVADRITPNEKTYVYDEIRHPGGNGINVARILARLKIPVLATGFLGGPTGEEIKYLLDDEKVRNSFTRIEGHSRISVTVSNRSDHNQTRLSFLGPQIKKDEKESLFRWVENQRGISLLVIGGSLPKGFSSKDIKHLMVLAQKRKVESIVDCPGHIMRTVIHERPLMIKPNLEEFQQLTKTKVKSLKAVLREAQNILDKVPLVCVSSVENGTLLVTRGESCYGRIPDIKIKSNVGAGDSMVGAMAAQLFNGNQSAQDLLRWGLAASAATLAHSGTAMGTAAEVHRLYRRTQVDPVR